MKTNKIIYWTSTGIFCALMLFSAYAYFTSVEAKTAFVNLGFPDFFRKELGVAKFLGAIALLAPITPPKIKEWAYAGFAFVIISAVIANFSMGESFLLA